MVGCRSDEAPQDGAGAPTAAIPSAGPQTLVGPPDASVVAEFTRRVREYVELREKLEDGMSRLRDEATPQQIDAHQRALAALVAKARADTRVGSVFLPDMQTFARGLLARVFDGPAGAQLRASIFDENPVDAKIAVNGRYPDAVPLSTMPPEVLQALPELPDDMEYRFVGRHLILLDTRSHVIVDFVENAIPD
jgi:hypothetical protein